MSSWTVSRRHIDLLVTAILAHRPDAAADAIRGAVPAADAAENAVTDADRIGQVLWAANHAAVNHRYDEDTPTPAYHYTPPDATTPPSTTQVEELLFLIKQVDCYAYQCAGLPAWGIHPARVWTAALRAHLIERLHRIRPGLEPARTHAYQAAPWGIG